MVVFEKITEVGMSEGSIEEATPFANCRESFLTECLLAANYVATKTDLHQELTSLLKRFISDHADELCSDAGGEGNSLDDWPELFV